MVRPLILVTNDDGLDAPGLQALCRALDPLGLPMSPFVLLQLVGPAVAFHVSETMNDAYPDRFYVSDNLRRGVAAGITGIWTYDNDGNRSVDAKVAENFQQGDSPAAGGQMDMAMPENLTRTPAVATDRPRGSEARKKPPFVILRL